MTSPSSAPRWVTLGQAAEAAGVALLEMRQALRDGRLHGHRGRQNGHDVTLLDLDELGRVFPAAAGLELHGPGLAERGIELAPARRPEPTGAPWRGAASPSAVAAPDPSGARAATDPALDPADAPASDPEDPSEVRLAVDELRERVREAREQSDRLRDDLGQRERQLRQLLERVERDPAPRDALERALGGERAEVARALERARRARRLSLGVAAACVAVLAAALLRPGAFGRGADEVHAGSAPGATRTPGPRAGEVPAGTAAADPSVRAEDPSEAPSKNRADERDEARVDAPLDDRVDAPRLGHGSGPEPDRPASAGAGAEPATDEGPTVADSTAAAGAPEAGAPAGPEPRAAAIDAASPPAHAPVVPEVEVPSAADSTTSPATDGRATTGGPADTSAGDPGGPAPPDGPDDADRTPWALRVAEATLAAFDEFAPVPPATSPGASAATHSEAEERADGVDGAVADAGPVALPVAGADSSGSALVGPEASSAEDADPDADPDAAPDPDARPRRASSEAPACAWHASTCAGGDLARVLGPCDGPWNPRLGAVAGTFVHRGERYCVQHLYFARDLGGRLADQRDAAAFAASEGLPAPLVQLRVDRSAARLLRDAVGGWVESGFEGGLPDEHRLVEEAPGRWRLETWVRLLDQGDRAARRDLTLRLELGAGDLDDHLLDLTWSGSR